MTRESFHNTHEPRHRLSLWCSAVALGCVAGLLLGLLVISYYVFVGGNLHIVLPHRCYRSAQPSVASLQLLARKYGIRTILNLRGRNVRAAWYHAEKRCAEALGARLEDLALSSAFVPTKADLSHLLRVLDDAETPCLMHCYGGSDRTGFAAACFLLLKTNANVQTASRQLALRFGHNPFGPARGLARVLDYYNLWLEKRGATHSQGSFRHWATAVYDSEEVNRYYSLPRRGKFDNEPPDAAMPFAWLLPVFSSRW